MLQFNLKDRGEAKKLNVAVHMLLPATAVELNHVEAGALMAVADELNRTQDPPITDHKPEMALTLVAKPPQPRVYVETILLLLDDTQPSEAGLVMPLLVRFDKIDT